jgi:hypothetical protein
MKRTESPGREIRPTGYCSTKPALRVFMTMSSLQPQKSHVAGKASVTSTGIGLAEPLEMQRLRRENFSPGPRVTFDSQPTN